MMEDFDHIEDGTQTDYIYTTTSVIAPSILPVHSPVDNKHIKGRPTVIKSHLNQNNSRKRPSCDPSTSEVYNQAFKSPRVDRLDFPSLGHDDGEEEEGDEGERERMNIGVEEEEEDGNIITEFGREEEENVNRITAEDDANANTDKHVRVISPDHHHVRVISPDQHVRVISPDQHVRVISPDHPSITVLPTSPSSLKQDYHAWLQSLPSAQTKTIPIMTLASNSPTPHQAAPTPLSSSLCLSGQGGYVYTPHPRSGQLFYISALPDGSPQLSLRPFEHGPDEVVESGDATPPFQQLEPGMLALNPACEEGVVTPGERGTCEGQTGNRGKFVKKPSYQLLQSPECQEEEPRETHNLKERKRRARIKEACDLMRNLIPGMSEKTDKATVFEFAARYIHFLKTFTGCQYDKDFLIKYSPY